MKGIFISPEPFRSLDTKSNIMVWPVKYPFYSFSKTGIKRIMFYIVFQTVSSKILADGENFWVRRHFLLHYKPTSLNQLKPVAPC